MKLGQVPDRGTLDAPKEPPAAPRPTELQQLVAATLRTAFDQTRQMMREGLADGRAKSMVLTKLDEAELWANAAELADALQA
jgi:hypothetical protein